MIRIAMTTTPCSFKDILDILACPKCRGALTIVENSAGSGLDCPSCGKIYPVKDGIPVLLMEKAVSKEDWAKGKHFAD